MKLLCKLIIVCALLIVTGATHAQTPGGQGGYPTYTINEGETIVLHGYTANAAAYQWYKDGMKINGALSKDYTATTAGVYTVVAYNFGGCTSEQSDGIRVIVNTATPPVIQPDTAVDLTIAIQSTNINATPGDKYSYILTANNNSKPNGTQVQVNYTLPPNIAYVPQLTDNGTVKYNDSTRTLTWDIKLLKENDPTKLVVSVMVLKPGVVESIVDIKGREHDPILENNVAQVIQQVNPLVVPNVFTPNGDGKNDKFVIPGLDTYSDTELIIINRWGNTVFQKTNYQNDWTGEGMVEGTYFYVLRAKTNAGVWDTYKGYLTLLRTKI